MFKPLILLGVTSNLLFASICSTPPELPQKYKDSKSYVSNYYEKLYNEKIIAKAADEMLSKLITKKSPVIKSWYARHDFKDANEEKVALTWRKYYLENYIIPSYPNNTNEINILLETFYTSTFNFSFDHKKMTEITNSFSQAKSFSIEYLKSIFGKEISAKLIARVNAIELNFNKIWDKKSPKGRLKEFFEWGVAYDPIPNKINIGLEILKYPNQMTLFNVFTHEIGHSFDPCRWSALIQGNNPFEKVIACLRSEQSVHALKRDDSNLSTLIAKQQIPLDVSMSLQSNPTCNKSFWPLPGKQKDQILESFADWFSAEILAFKDLVKSTSDLRTDLCEKAILQKGSSYPENIDRLMKIYLANPIIHKKLEMNNKAAYCSFK